MANKNKFKTSKKSKKNPFLGSLDHLGGKKLMQRGAEGPKAKESRKHSVGGGKRG
jgi:hypothetical protein